MYLTKKKKNNSPSEATYTRRRAHQNRTRARKVQNCIAKMRSQKVFNYLVTSKCSLTIQRATRLWHRLLFNKGPSKNATHSLQRPEIGAVRRKYATSKTICSIYHLTVYPRTSRLRHILMKGKTDTNGLTVKEEVP